MSLRRETIVEQTWKKVGRGRLTGEVDESKLEGGGVTNKILRIGKSML